MNWLGQLGTVLLLYAPVAYLLVRRGRGWWMWAGAVAVAPLSVSAVVGTSVAAFAHRGVASSGVTVLSSGALFAVVLAGCRPLVSVGRRSLAGFGFLVGALGATGHLLGGVVAPTGVRPPYPVLVSEYTLRFVAATPTEVNQGMLVCGVVAFGVALGEARVRKSRAESWSRTR